MNLELLILEIQLIKRQVHFLSLILKPRFNLKCRKKQVEKKLEKIYGKLDFKLFHVNKISKCFIDSSIFYM